MFPTRSGRDAPSLGFFTRGQVESHGSSEFPVQVWNFTVSLYEHPLSSDEFSLS